QESGRMRGFQLWINLPATEKMTSPEYQEYSPASIPLVETDTMCVKIICGDYMSQQGLISDPITQVQYLDVKLNANQDFSHFIDSRFSSFIYLFEGGADYSGSDFSEHSMLVLGEGEGIELTSGSSGCRFILVAGLPIGEPIVQYGPFVMNTKEEIEQAIHDYRSGTLVSNKAAFHSDV
ncbi:MAG: pirin family protein, partial [Gammaproteobacteria bacterium]|nr:pirin family protein [Gammaproteobacteria bacterium]